MSVHKILNYFPGLSENQINIFSRMEVLYREWNEKINVVSRKDMDNLVERHILHSMSIALFVHFKNGNQIIDVGTGGGFPGIPLAVLFEKCHFTLIDSIGKKIKVVNEIVKELGIKNVRTFQIRSENHHGKYEYIVSRAVTNLPDFIERNRHLVKHGEGIIYLKGGDFDDELKKIKSPFQLFDISKKIKEPFFETKKMVLIKNIE